MEAVLQNITLQLSQRSIGGQQYIELTLPGACLRLCRPYIRYQARHNGNRSATARSFHALFNVTVVRLCCGKIISNSINGLGMARGKIAALFGSACLEQDRMALGW